jgi:porin
MPRRYNQAIVRGLRRGAKRLTKLAKLKCKLSVALIILVGGSAIAAAEAPTEKSVLSADSPSVLGELSRTQKWLADLGINLNAAYSNSVLANLKGGLRRGTIDQGKLETVLAIDLEKLAGYSGLSFYANTFQIHNTGRFRRDYIGGINTIDAIEALSTTRLSELWLEQKFWNGNATVRFGQLAADIEFFNSGLSEIFLQSDWATITAVNLPSGGPAYPLSTPGIRLKIEPRDNVSLLMAVFNGDPAGPGTGDPQVRNRHGLNFRVGDPPLFMVEGQVRNNYRPGETGLATAVKAGSWLHLGSFDDQRFAADGTLLAADGPMTAPAQHRGNFGVYGVIEQQLYRPQGGSATSGVSMFSRISVSPSDRNPISFFFDGGLVFSNMIPSRPDDKFGASVIYSRFSNAARAFDQDKIIVTGVPGIVRDYEMNLELTYLAQVSPGWTVQPVVTYIWHPNGDAERNALATGVKSIWRF